VREWTVKVVCKNDLIDEANALDAAEVMRDAEGVQLVESVEVAKTESAP
jgi:hypothetical protein